MMDQRGYQPSGLFGGYSYGDPTLNVPVTSGGSSTISPYLNLDPRYLNTGDAEFIVPTGQSRVRGRFELGFSQIGGSVMAGAVYGGVNGVRVARSQTAELTGKVRMSQMLTLVSKQGASAANAVGVVAVMYSILGLGISWARGTEDEFNTISAATATGLLYKSSAGLKTMAKGGAVGLTLSSLWCLYHNKDNILGSQTNY